MIGGDLDARPFAEKIGARVADVGDEGLTASDHQYFQRGSHAALVGFTSAALEDCLMSVLDRLLEQGDQRFAGFLGRIGREGRQPGASLGQRAPHLVDGHRAGHFASGVTAHAIGDDEKATFRIDIGAVLVVLTDIANVGFEVRDNLCGEGHGRDFRERLCTRHHPDVQARCPSQMSKPDPSKTSSQVDADYMLGPDLRSGRKADTLSYTASPCLGIM